MATKNIMVLPGDGIGYDVTQEALKVLRKIELKYGHTFTVEEGLIGGAALDAHGTPMTEETFALCKQSDAVMLGAIGGPKWDNNPAELRPEKALIGLRKELGVFTNLRFAKAYDELIDSSPLKNERVIGTDIVIVRELTGGVYFGEPRGFRNEGADETGYNTLVYSRGEVKRITKVACDIAMKRRKQLTSVDKANILESSQLWRKVVIEMVEKDYPEIDLDHLYIDNACMQLVLRPNQFDVILSTNMFGDILSDLASILGGSLGMMPSASLGGPTGLYEPVHGSAPDIQGKNLANPTAMILSTALMLRYSFDMMDEADAVEAAVDRVLQEGYRTKDIAKEGDTAVGTNELGDLIVERL